MTCFRNVDDDPGRCLTPIVHSTLAPSRATLAREAATRRGLAFPRIAPKLLAIGGRVVAIRGQA
ncbi:MAG: hypothetical protein ACJ8IK_04870 [Burkholderiaceae bacterium]